MTEGQRKRRSELDVVFRDRAAHLDATFFHFVSTLVLYFSVRAAQSPHGWRWAVASVIAAIGAVFLSYGMLPLVGLGLSVTTLLVCEGSADGRLRRAASLVLSQFLGYLLGASVLMATCYWRPLTQYKIAYAYHLAWMGNDWAWRTWRPVGLSSSTFPRVPVRAPRLPHARARNRRMRTPLAILGAMARVRGLPYPSLPSEGGEAREGRTDGRLRAGPDESLRSDVDPTSMDPTTCRLSTRRRCGGA